MKLTIVGQSNGAQVNQELVMDFADIYIELSDGSNVRIETHFDALIVGAKDRGSTIGIKPLRRNSIYVKIVKKQKRLKK